MTYEARDFESIQTILRELAVNEGASTYEVRQMGDIIGMFSPVRLLGTYADYSNMTPMDLLRDVGDFWSITIAYTGANVLSFGRTYKIVDGNVPKHLEISRNRSTKQVLTEY